MMEGIRRATKSWLGKIVFGALFALLIVSFAVWGIGDIFRGFGTGVVAKVGEREITTEEFRNAYQTQLQSWQREARRAVTNDEARAAGLDRLVLSRLISEAALNQRASDLGLAMADANIAQAIVNDPAFQGPGGRFERQRFNDALREAGYPNEQRFLLEQRQSYLRRELALSVAGEPPIPRALMEAAHRYGTETRSVEFFRLPETFAGEIPPPDQAALEKFYEQRKPAFRAPEYRTVSFLHVSPQGVADPSKISEEDARKFYEQVKDVRFTVPERREVQQMVLPSEEEAAKERARIAAGADFEAIATERNLTPKDISLGLMAWSDFVDPNVAQAAFALPVGEVSQPVKSQFGSTLLRVTRLEPQRVRPFDEVAGEVRTELAKRRSGDEVRRIRDVIEDARTAGRPLAEAAKQAGMSTSTIDIDSGARNRAGEPVADLPERENFVRAVFASDIGVDNDVLTTREGGYVWFEIGSIDPARDRTLEEVRERVVAAWRADEIARILQEKAQELVKRIEAGEAVEAVAKSVGLEPGFDAEVRRLTPSRLPPPAVVRAFSVRVGSAGSVADGTTRVVFKVLDAVVPPFNPDEPAIKGLEPQLRNAMTEDILAQYVARVQDELGVSINETAVRSVVGGSELN